MDGESDSSAREFVVESVEGYDLPFTTSGTMLSTSCFRYIRGLREDVYTVLVKPWKGIPLVRINSECSLGRLGSVQCDCEWQYQHAKHRILREGGILVFAHNQTGKGRGLYLQHLMNSNLSRKHGKPLHEIHAYDEDYREYAYAADILSRLGITSLTLLTNNARKVAALTERGFDVRQASIKSPVHAFNHLVCRKKYG